MISFELNIIDWNAISAIATTLALIVAFVTIIVSNCQERKNRKLQVLLLHKDQQQKQLDLFHFLLFVKKLIRQYPPLVNITPAIMFCKLQNIR